MLTFLQRKQAGVLYIWGAKGGKMRDSEKVYSKEELLNMEISLLYYLQKIKKGNMFMHQRIQKRSIGSMLVRKILS